MFSIRLNTTRDNGQKYYICARRDNGFIPAYRAYFFINGNKMGVVVWNVSDGTPSSFTVTPDAGWKLAETAAPEGETVEGPLRAQSIRLLIFERL